MSFEELALHKAIGWDIDGTLVDSDKAETLHAFIRQHPDIRHVLVTFRTHGLVQEIDRDLARAGLRDTEVFSDRLTIPPSMWLSWAVLQQKRRESRLHGRLLLPESEYREWKGFACRQNGVTALVDDDKLNTEAGCRRYGIAWFDANQL